MQAGIARFTQFDPFEDTERTWARAALAGQSRFTQFDPFEDTESLPLPLPLPRLLVSPNSIRSRILKVDAPAFPGI